MSSLQVNIFYNQGKTDLELEEDSGLLLSRVALPKT